MFDSFLGVAHDGGENGNEGWVLKVAWEFRVAHDGIENVHHISILTLLFLQFILSILDVPQKLSIVGVVFQALSVGRDSLLVLVQIELGSSFPLVSSGPGWIDSLSKKSLLDAGLGVLQGLLELLVVEISSRSVRVKDVIFRIELNSLREVLDGLLIALCFEGFIAFVFELGG